MWHQAEHAARVVAHARDESLGAMECRTAAVYPGGDHSIIVADVLSLHLAQDEEPALLYHRGRYGVAP